MNWFKTDEGDGMEKKPMGADRWSEMPFKMKEHMPEMIDRCEQDVIGLRALYERVKPLIKDVSR